MAGEDSKHSLLSALMKLEADFRKALLGGTDLGPLVSLAHKIFYAVRTACNQQDAHPVVVAELVTIVRRIHIVSSHLAALEQVCTNSEYAFVQKLRLELDRDAAAYETGARPSSEAERPAEASFLPYRDWFLSHFDSPYPLGADRDHLLAAVPSHDRLQLENWFANARRRSGWTAFRREFAHDSPALFRRLLDSIDEPGNEAARDRYEKVRLYFEPDRQGEVSETIRTLVRQGPPSEAPGRAGRRLAKRATRGVGAQQPVEAPLTPESNRSPRRRQRNASSDSFQPDIEVDFYPNPPPAGLSEEARYPSSFASPTSSLRSVSNSSSSSLDSLISYGSSDYAPAVMRMEQPISATMNAPWAGSAAPVSGGGPPSTSPPRLALPVPLVRSSPVGALVAPAPQRAAHPFFCTVDELPSASSWATPTGAAPSRA